MKLPASACVKSIKNGYNAHRPDFLGNKASICLTNEIVLLHMCLYYRITIFNFCPDLGYITRVIHRVFLLSASVRVFSVIGILIGRYRCALSPFLFYRREQKKERAFSNSKKWRRERGPFSVFPNMESEK